MISQHFAVATLSVFVFPAHRRSPENTNTCEGSFEAQDPRLRPRDQAPIYCLGSYDAHTEWEMVTRVVEGTN